MTSHSITEERKHRIGLQTVDISDLDCSGLILDIGGGGEGVIGQKLGSKIVAIDPDLEELEEAPDGPLKIVMDARELKFLSGTFDYVTSFFTMMFIKKESHKAVFDEIYRVLKAGGEFLLWDVKIPKYDGGPQDIFVFPLKVNLGEKLIETGYGALWPEKDQDMQYYIGLGEEAGFTMISSEVSGEVFSIRYRK